MREPEILHILGAAKDVRVRVSGFDESIPIGTTATQNQSCMDEAWSQEIPVEVDRIGVRCKRSFVGADERDLPSFEPRAVANGSTLL